MVSKQSKHEELRQGLQAEIAGMAAHAALPTEREIAARYEVSRNTVRQALDGLFSAGTVYRVQGAGTFVASRMVSKSPALTSFSDDMLERGLRPGSRVLTAELVRAGSVADQLDLAAEAEVVRLSRLRLADDSPMCLEHVHLPAVRVPGLLELDLADSLYACLRRHYQLEIARAEQTVRSVELDATEAALLGVPTGAAGLRVTRTGLDQRDRPLEATTTTYRADRYEVRFAVRRNP